VWAGGDNVGVKTSEKTQLTDRLRSEVMKNDGGHKGVYKVILGKGSQIGKALITNPGLDAITFTG